MDFQGALRLEHVSSMIHFDPNSLHALDVATLVSRTYRRAARHCVLMSWQALILILLWITFAFGNYSTRAAAVPQKGSRHAMNEEPKERSVRYFDRDMRPSEAASAASPHQFRHQRAATLEGRKFQQQRALSASTLQHGDPGGDFKRPSVTPPQTPPSVTAPAPQESLASKVPLRLQIKVSGQRGSLGISIAGGRGSLPYKDHDEGIFISRVTKGGPSEKAGVHVGDRLLEVNSINMQGATHLEAVSALRNAGSCISMRVLRDNVHPSMVNRPQYPQEAPGPQWCSDQECGAHSWQMKSSERCATQDIVAVVCNGNGISELQRKMNWMFSPAEAMTSNDSQEEEKHSMRIPRIILTHPSTSDDDGELLTQIQSRELQQDRNVPERPTQLDSFDSAFYPP
ncbi:uncharacterized protein ACB058_010706 [Synchiropus picturatus]